MGGIGISNSVPTLKDIKIPNTFAGSVDMPMLFTII